MDMKFSEEEIPAANYFCTKGTVRLDSIQSFFGPNLMKVMGEAAEEKLTVTGPPSGIYWSFDQTAGVSEMAVGIPVKEEAVKAPKDFSVVQGSGRQGTGCFLLWRLRQYPPGSYGY
jgi:hypothetical protein